jgi:hypothetical protein
MAVEKADVTMSQPQTYANHARFDPAFHYFAAPVFLINVIYRIVEVFHHLTFGRIWSAVLALALLVLSFLTRTYALRVQDRIIRMEERVRIAAVASPETLARMDEFTLPQFVALRFAPWSELGPLADRALAEKLSAKQIKQAIVAWRPDTHRV